MDSFVLHPRLAADCEDLGRLGVSRLLLMNDARYPWLILVPERDGVRELHQLIRSDRHRLSDDSARLAEAMQAVFAPDKLNIASLGNSVPQLHLHHVARYRTDPAWPGPVWGHSAPVPYEPATLAESRERLLRALADVDPAEPT